MTAKIRQLPTYVLNSVPKKPILRQIPTYVLHGKDGPLPRGVSGKQGVFNMIKEQALRELGLGDLVFGLPETTTEHGCNTRVLVSGTYGTGILGELYFYYNRAEMKRIYLSRSFTRNGLVTAHELVGQLSIASGLVLVENDFVNTSYANGRITLIAATTSYFFQPGTSLEVVLG